MSRLFASIVLALTASLFGASVVSADAPATPAPAAVQHVHPEYPWACHSAYGNYSGYAYCDSPSGSGWVRVVLHCWSIVEQRTVYVYGPWSWVAPGNSSWAYCEWAGYARWNYRVTGAHYQIR